MKPGYKQTAVGIIPEEWEVKRLGELFDFSGGYSASRDQLSVTGHCYLHYGDIHGSSKTSIDTDADFQDIPKLDIPLNKVSTKSLLADGDVVFVDASEDDAGTSKHVVVVNKDKKPFISGLHTIVAKSKSDELNHEYRHYCFQTTVTRSQFLFFAVGTKVSGISKSNIPKLQLPLPPLPEQIAIAAALGDVDGLLGGLERLITKKRDLKQAAMQQLLTGQTRLPGFDGAWEVKRLGEVAQISKGQLITSSTLKQGDIPVIAGGKQPAYYHSSANRFGRTITISASGASAGYVALYEEPIFASDCSTISESENYCLDFIFYQLLCKQQTIYKAQTGGAQPHIHAKDLYPILFSFPPLPEQIAIAAVLSDMDAELVALEQRRTKTRALKQAMMQELLTGRTRLI